MWHITDSLTHLSTSLDKNSIFFLLSANNASEADVKVNTYTRLSDSISH